MGYLRIPTNVAQRIAAPEPGRIGVPLILSLFYIVQGFFFDGVSTIAMSLAITFPLGQQAGFDPIWFGIYLVFMVEMAQIAPPGCVNLFAIRELTGRPIGKVTLAALPFFFLMARAVV